MIHSDLSLNKERIKELVTIKLQYFFSDSKIAQVILTIAVLLLVWQSYLLLHLYSGYKNWQLPQVQQIFNAKNDHTRTQSIDIASKHIFGEVIKSLDSLAEAIKSRLPITLKGVIADSQNPKAGQVIIQDNSGKQKVYGVGDRLSINSSKIILEYVFKEKIYLKNNGTLEYILYPIVDLTNKNTSRNNINKNNTQSNKNSNSMKSSTTSTSSHGLSMTGPQVNQDDDDDEDNLPAAPDQRMESMINNNQQHIADPNAENLNRRLYNRANRPSRVNRPVVGPQTMNNIHNQNKKNL